jgi:hypothetical protein
MPKIGTEYVNPFYRSVDGFVRNELNTRASYYGRRVRSAGQSVPKNLLWSYEKVAWGHVISVDYPSIKLGFPGSKVMSDKDGNLTLYSSQRNVPKKPLLTGIEISNEGTMGSLLKGKFTFTVFPVLTASGFDLGKLEQAFFTPGKEVEVSWGWSVAANNQAACSQQFTGIIYNFNWTFNNDMSVTADVSIVSAASVVLGQSGDQSVSKDADASAPKDPKEVALEGNNLITVIDQDLAILTGSYAKVSEGQSIYVGKSNIKGGSNLLDYTGIGLPFQESSDVDANGNPKQKPIPKNFWYVKIKDVTEFANELLKNNEEFKKLYRIVSWGNEADYNKDVKSSYPIDVYFPDEEMGTYGQVIKPFVGDDARLAGQKGGVTEGTINIGEILLGVDYVKKTYKEFVEENSANIPFKNITNFFEKLIKRVNEATGDAYQLTVQLIEPREPSGKIDSSVGEIKTTIVSIEDTNLSKVHTDKVKENAYRFDATIFKPLIKNVSISSKPPGPMATAAYAQARSGNNAEGKVKPSNSDVSTATLSEKATEEFEKELKDAEDALKKDLELTGNVGFNDAWSERVRGNFVKVKKSKLKGDGKNGAHWLNEAVYPIDLTITIDGISGFKFGDVIRTSLIPKHYNDKYDMVFTVTKISHSIKDGTWETTLNTKSRISMDK